MRILQANQLLVGMTTGMDLLYKDNVFLKEKTILTEQDINSIIDTFGEEKLVWVCDLIELKQDIYGETKLSNIYIDYVVNFYKQLLSSSLTNSEKFNRLIKGFRNYLYKNRDALYDLFVLRENHCYTFEHSISVAMYATLIGISMELTDKELYNLVIGGLLHDIGKLKISNTILDKPTKLSDAEFLAIQQHPNYGLLLAKNLSEITTEMRNIIEQHHEKLNGTGYPNKLKNNDISYLSKIITVCDIFDAVTSKRSYHDPISCEKGFEILRSEVSRDNISKEIVDILEKQLTHFMKNTFVTLNNGETCLVLTEREGNQPPVVLSCTTKQIYDLSIVNLYIVDTKNTRLWI